MVIPDSPFRYNGPSSPLLGKRRVHLALVANRNVNHEPDFVRMVEFLREIDPKIRPFLISDRRKGVFQLLPLALRPTLMFSPTPLRRFRPLRGPVFAGHSLPKSEEYRRLEALGFPVPKWKLVSDEEPDLSDFGPYVVTKPDRGMRGAMVKIQKKGRVRKKKQPSLAATKGEKDRFGPKVTGDGPILAQEFIYTGKWPVNHRVTTLFGQVIHSFHQEASNERAPLEGPEAFGKMPGDQGVSIVASSKGCKMRFNYDEEIIRLGEAAHAAFPEIPLLGIDIVRDANTGKLYILEVNSVGYVWHFSSPMGLRFQNEFGFRLEEQFDGLRKAAHILAAKAQELAR